MSNFDEIKPGDMVALLRDTAFGSAAYLMKVERVTKTQIILENIGHRFSRVTGWTIGSGAWDTDHIEYPVTDDHRRRIAICEARSKHVRLCNQLSSFHWRDLDYETLVKVAQLIGLEVKA